MVDGDGIVTMTTNSDGNCTDDDKDDRKFEFSSEPFIIGNSFIANLIKNMITIIIKSMMTIMTEKTLSSIPKAFLNSLNNSFFSWSSRKLAGNI